MRAGKAKACPFCWVLAAHEPDYKVAHRAISLAHKRLNKAAFKAVMGLNQGYAVHTACNDGWLTCINDTMTPCLLWCGGFCCREEDVEAYLSQKGDSHYLFELLPRGDFTDDGKRLPEGETVERQAK